ncbi:hypothetical protein BH18THE1_BH18THE1_11690 [soil metagenome]
MQKEIKLQDFIDVSSNPFYQGKAIVGLGNKKPEISYQKERQRVLKRIEVEKDEDIKRELRKGNIVYVIEDSMDYQ